MIITSCGLHVMADKSYLGTSLDGLVVCTSVNTLCNGCLKMKCPYSIDRSVTTELLLSALQRNLEINLSLNLEVYFCHMIIIHN